MDVVPDDLESSLQGAFFCLFFACFLPIFKLDTFLNRLFYQDENPDASL